MTASVIWSATSTPWLAPVGLVLALVGETGLAQQAGPEPALQYVTQSVIGGEALAGSQGVVTVNMAAGDFNLQINGAAIALNLDAQRGMGIAEAGIGMQQHVQTVGYTNPDLAVAAIRDSAFQNASGLISVNQVSGVANAQANEFALVLGFAGNEVSEDALAQSFSNATQVNVELGPVRAREVSVADTSFRGAQGVAQVTQTAGSWNATTNSFALRITVDANQ